MRHKIGVRVFDISSFTHSSASRKRSIQLNSFFKGYLKLKEMYPILKAQQMKILKSVEFDLARRVFDDKSRQ